MSTAQPPKLWRVHCSAKKKPAVGELRFVSEGMGYDRRDFLVQLGYPGGVYSAVCRQFGSMVDLRVLNELRRAGALQDQGPIAEMEYLKTDPDTVTYEGDPFGVVVMPIAPADHVIPGLNRKLITPQNVMSLLLLAQRLLPYGLVSGTIDRSAFVLRGNTWRLCNLDGLQLMGTQETFQLGPCAPPDAAKLPLVGDMQLQATVTLHCILVSIAQCYNADVLEAYENPRNQAHELPTIQSRTAYLEYWDAVDASLAPFT